MFHLGLLQLGDRAEVVNIISGNHSGTRMEDLDFLARKTFEMLNNVGRGSLPIKVYESRLAFGRGMAMKIMVRRYNSGSRRACSQTMEGLQLASRAKNNYHGCGLQQDLGDIYAVYGLNKNTNDREVRFLLGVPF